ncbi:hypothetical protein L1987_58423 [Smallanthus sonchifolius]|uniref:Uncharacterized protein n=1 Tax=Smallanthus sonchifolius TaxID=185202 RepID=A0ACB9DFH6_9ASTR|nr:hypothetical protein L1987_58423 [Smallanthus sonchifolius]
MAQWISSLPPKRSLIIIFYLESQRFPNQSPSKTSSTSSNHTSENPLYSHAEYPLWGGLGMNLKGRLWFTEGLGVYEAIEACTMEMPGALNFEVGQLAEMRSLEYGYRGAWFRCKIEDIVLEQNMILPDYYDFDPAELQWEKIYQALRYGNEKQLMVRPQYPSLYNKSEMPSLKSISQACVCLEGWRLGRLV